MAGTVLATTAVDRLKAGALKDLGNALTARERFVTAKKSAETVIAETAVKIKDADERLRTAVKDLEWIAEFESRSGAELEADTDGLLAKARAILAGDEPADGADVEPDGDGA